ncbi:glucokinase [Alkalispirochaeta americana]|uniref:Glucokinase n=1 Tax=Alkalispirochaeta americana TaxID=159291 RepID=A0A1N6Q560_9SPIO|nr:ROK family protein [Alkalispirochaeta americana]SIQ11677.1 glucokinase [Alkalispirochaeta americana]
MIHPDELGQLLCGVDLGGTKIVTALVSDDGTVRAKRFIRDHRGQSPQMVVEGIARQVRELLADQNIPLSSLSGIGVGTSGHVDYRNRRIIMNSNLPGFAGFPLGQALEDALGVAVSLDNDANAQAYAEYRFGAGQGFPHMAFVTVSTGIGAGLVLGGSLYRGVTGTAGELGHTIVEPAGIIRCGCGRQGCLMAHAAGLCLGRTARELQEEEALPSEVITDDLQDQQITGEVVARGLAVGDPLCCRLVQRYADYLAIGLNNLFQILDPGLIVLGGGLTAWGPVYLDRVRAQFAKHLRGMTTAPPEIRLALLGADAAVVGAASLPLEGISLKEHP